SATSIRETDGYLNYKITAATHSSDWCGNEKPNKKSKCNARYKDGTRRLPAFKGKGNNKENSRRAIVASGSSSEVPSNPSIGSKVDNPDEAYSFQEVMPRALESFSTKGFFSPSKQSFKSIETANAVGPFVDKSQKPIQSKTVQKCSHTKERLIMNGFKHYDDLVIRQSSIHGLGIFTPVFIPENTLIMEYKGEIIGKCMSDKREKLYKMNSIDSVYMFSVSEDMIIDATMTGNKARYINHSCNPNCEAIHSVVDKSIKYCSTRDILPDEELTINYNMSQDIYGEKCNCGDSECKSNKKNHK
ncbi:uncharacterized protein VICG_00253, partial [Vittaforma corneae ATCC 50505]